jgi:hypothetical protein
LDILKLRQQLSYETKAKKGVKPMQEDIEVRSMAPVPVTVAAFVDMPYSPAVLLESRFDVSMTGDGEFRAGCELGYGTYFEGMFEWNESCTDIVFVEKCYSWREVVEFVVATGCHRDEPEPTPRSWSAGFGLGWLSALALTNRHEAVMGLTVLTALLLPYQ